MQTSLKPSYCPSTGVTYRQKIYYCPPAPTPPSPPTIIPPPPPPPTPPTNLVNTTYTYTTRQYCSQTKEFYYSKSYKCSKSDQLRNGAIIGGIIGGIVVLLLLLGGAYLIVKKKREATAQIMPTPPPTITINPLETDTSLIHARSRNQVLPTQDSHQTLTTSTISAPPDPNLQSSSTLNDTSTMLKNDATSQA